MGSMLYGRGIFINRCYDELNVTQPDLVRTIHQEYLQAGAVVLEANTFGANRIRLERFGFESRVRELNRAGIRLARDCASAAAEKHATEVFVAGAIGPLGGRVGQGTKISLDEAYEAYAEQIKAQAEAGADLLIIETMMSLAECEQALRAAKAAAPGAPRHRHAHGRRSRQRARRHHARRCRAPARIAGAPTPSAATAPKAPPSCSPPLSACARPRSCRSPPCPTPARPSVVDGRSLYLTSPEYMAGFARKFARAGATFIGGCCGTTPQHIRSMRGALRALEAQETGVEVIESGADRTAGAEQNHCRRRSATAAKSAP